MRQKARVLQSCYDTQKVQVVIADHSKQKQWEENLLAEKNLGDYFACNIASLFRVVASN